MEIKRNIYYLLFAILLISLSLISCDKSENISNIEGTSFIDENENENFILPMMDSSEDNTQPIRTDLKFFREYIQLSSKAEETGINMKLISMNDLSDGVLLLYSNYSNGLSDIVFQKVSDKSGKQIMSMSYNIKGKIYYVQEIKKQITADYNFIENGVLVFTSEGAYIFDFLDISKEPYFSPVPKDIINNSGMFTNQDKDKDRYYNYSMYDMYLQDDKTVYINNNGVFLYNQNDDSTIKLSDHPQQVKEEIKSKVKMNIQGENLVLINPRFINDGKSVLLDIISEDTYINIGISIIDIETKTVSYYKYYDQDSFIYDSQENLEFINAVYNGYEIIDKNLIRITGVLHNIQDNNKENVLPKQINAIIDSSDLNSVQVYSSPVGLMYDTNNILVTDIYRRGLGKVEVYNISDKKFKSHITVEKACQWEILSISKKYILFSSWSSGEETGKVKVLVPYNNSLRWFMNLMLIESKH